MFKEIIVLAFIAIACTTAETNSNTQYDFSYSVEDQNTGDVKTHQETNRNGNVRGQYSLIDADGFRRTVDYKADDRNGFNSEVRREPVYFQRDNLRTALRYTPLLTPVYHINTFAVPTSYSSVSRTDGVRNDYQQQLARHQQDVDNQIRQMEQHSIALTGRSQFATQNEQDETTDQRQGRFTDTTVNTVRRQQQNQMDNAANYHEETIHNVLKSQQQQLEVEQHEQQQQHQHHQSQSMRNMF